MLMSVAIIPRIILTLFFQNGGWKLGKATTFVVAEHSGMAAKRSFRFACIIGALNEKIVRGIIYSNYPLEFSREQVFLNLSGGNAGPYNQLAFLICS